MALYENLTKLNRGTVVKVIGVLETADFNPRASHDQMPYLKNNLCDAILEELDRWHIPTTKPSTMYGTIPKKPMKRIYYGLRLLDEMPSNFMQALHLDEYSNWLEMCFAAGAWNRKPVNAAQFSRMPDGYRGMTLPEFVARYVRDGMGWLNEIYYRMKKSGKLKAHQQIPYDSDIRRELNRAIEEAKNQGTLTIEEIINGRKELKKPKPLQLELEI